MERAGAEGVPRPGGFDGSPQAAGGDVYPLVLIVGVASLRPRRHAAQADVGEPRPQDGRAPVEVRLPGHERQLVVGDLQHAALAQAPGDLRPGLLQVRPQGGPEVGVEGEQGPAGLRQGDGPAGGPADPLVGHGQGAEVEGPAPRQQRLRDLLLGEGHVRAGVAVEGEVPVPVRQLLHEGQGGPGRIVPDQAAGADARLPDHRLQHVPEHVPAHLAHEQAAAAQLLQHGENVAGGPAGVGLEQGVALPAEAVFRKVHQQLSQRDYVKCFFRHVSSLLVRNQVSTVYLTGGRRATCFWAAGPVFSYSSIRITP